MIRDEERNAHITAWEAMQLLKIAVEKLELSLREQRRVLKMEPRVRPADR